jgi:hypothetical protein
MLGRFAFSCTRGLIYRTIEHDTIIVTIGKTNTFRFSIFRFLKGVSKMPIRIEGSKMSMKVRF